LKNDTLQIIYAAIALIKLIINGKIDVFRAEVFKTEKLYCEYRPVIKFAIVKDVICVCHFYS